MTSDPPLRIRKAKGCLGSSAGATSQPHRSTVAGGAESSPRGWTCSEPALKEHWRSSQPRSVSTLRRPGGGGRGRSYSQDESKGGAQGEEAGLLTTPGILLIQGGDLGQGGFLPGEVDNSGDFTARRSTHRARQPRQSTSLRFTWGGEEVPPVRPSATQHKKKKSMKGATSGVVGEAGDRGHCQRNVSRGPLPESGRFKWAVSIWLPEYSWECLTERMHQYRYTHLCLYGAGKLICNRTIHHAGCVFVYIYIHTRMQINIDIYNIYIYTRTHIVCTVCVCVCI